MPCYGGHDLLLLVCRLVHDLWELFLLPLICHVRKLISGVAIRREFFRIDVRVHGLLRFAAR